MNQIEHFPTLVERGEAGWKRLCLDSLLAIGGALLTTGIIYAFHLYPSIPNISLIYLLVVLALASTRGLYAAVLTSLVASSSFDFFLIPPLYTFTIARGEEWLALLVFLATAIITGQLASALRQRAEQARRRERETHILYELVRATNRDEDLQQQLQIVVQAMVEVFSPWGVRQCALLLPEASGKLVVQVSTYPQSEYNTLSSQEEATAQWVMTHVQTVELYDVPSMPRVPSGTPSSEFTTREAVSPPVRRFLRLIPLKMGQQVIGVMRLLIEDDPRRTPDEKDLGVDRDKSTPHTRFFWTFLDQAASIIERARLRRESLEIQSLQRTDALRAALLSSVSHDLRTPLASIKAAASSLLQEEVQWDEEARRSFALAIEQESDRLNRLVENLLDMSRIEGGALSPQKEWYPVDELIHDVLGRLAPLLAGRTVRTSFPDDLPPVELDYLQLDQVLTNLLENAVRYTPPASPIEVWAEVEGEYMIISVADRGPGIPPAESERIFDKFYRVLRPEHQGMPQYGSGLGLAVCRGLVEAHGGRIWVENRKEGGAIFRFTLPLGETDKVDHGTDNREILSKF